ncbi:MAG: TAXI family TRAP transporter solute-binding subunit [Syntrophomonadaceae bacterium]|nr:TAXI family TRAP transporter solute-binding subunit [Syntrophomonadaceae bacterium]
MAIHRKKHGLIILLVVVLMLSTVMAGCGAKTGKEAPKPEEKKVERKWVSIATASTVGAWYVVGGGIAAVITKHVPHIQANVETSGATLENLRNLQDKKVDMAFAQPDIVHRAYTGTGLYEGKKFDTIRALTSTNRSVAHFIAPKDSPIKSLKDVKGRRIGVGAPGSGTEVYAKNVLSKYGFTYDHVEEQFLSVPEQVTAMGDGNLDLSISLMPVPTGVFMEFALTKGMRLIPMDKEVVDQLVKELPGWLADTIKAGTYSGQQQDISTMSWRGIIITRADMTEEDAYQITRAIWEKRDEWKDAHAVTADMTLNTALDGIPVPLHPGAVRYYREKGMTIPAELLPPELRR